MIGLLKSLEDLTKEDVQFEYEIKQSAIPNAGLGVFAISHIPAGYYGEVVGLFTDIPPSDPKYVWKHPFKNLYMDASLHTEHTNWCRYVNCCHPSSIPPIEMQFILADDDKEKDRVIYVFRSSVSPDEELLCWYGWKAWRCISNKQQDNQNEQQDYQNEQQNNQNEQQNNGRMFTSQRIDTRAGL